MSTKGFVIDFTLFPLTHKKRDHMMFDLPCSDVIFKFVGQHKPRRQPRRNASVPNIAYISPISVPYIIKIKAIFQLLEFGENLKNSDPPPLVKASRRHLKCRLF